MSVDDYSLVIYSTVSVTFKKKSVREVVTEDLTQTRTIKSCFYDDWVYSHHR